MSGQTRSFAAKIAQSVRGTVKAVFSAIAASFALLAAAGSAAQAVKLHRQPAEADLQKLGMSGVSFKRYI